MNLPRTLGKHEHPYDDIMDTIPAMYLQCNISYQVGSDAGFSSFFVNKS